MGEADPFIRFYCENCDYKTTVSEGYAGKTIRCPKCYNRISIPPIESTGTTNQSSSGKPETPSKYSDYDLALLNISEKEKIQYLQNSIYEETDEFEQEPGEQSRAETEPVAQRKLPWPIDIFLYPLSISGIIHLVICLCTPIFISLIYQFLLQYIWPIGELILAILYVLFVGYVMYYLSWCVIDSTKGGLRAPDISLQSSPAKGELIECVGILLGCIVVCFWPVTVYYIFTEKTGFLYWLLTAVGLLFFPMTLLACFLHGSIKGLKPVLIIKSVINTFTIYFPVVIFFAGFFVVLSVVTPQLPQSKGLESMSIYLSKVIYNIFSSRFALRLTGFIYLAMIGAHILGRFYYRCKEKLNWDV